MAPPLRTGDPDARSELYQLRTAAKYAEDRQWLTAAEMLQSKRLTASQAAHALGVSEPTFWRKIKPWTDHLDAGPGVGP